MWLGNLILVLASGGLVVAAAFAIGAIVCNIRQELEEKSITHDAVVIWVICGVISLGAAFGGIMEMLSVVLS